MKIHTLVLTALVASTAAISTSQAAFIVNDNFDSYANQAAFEAVWAPIGTVAPLSGALSTAQASSPTQSISNPGTLTSAQLRNRRTFAETGTLNIGDTLTWSFDFYDVSGTNSPSRNFSNLQDSTAPGSTNQLVSMGLNNNQTGANSGGQYYMARILGYTVPAADPDGGPAESVTGAGIYFKLNDFATSPLRSTGWHNLKVIMSTADGVSTDYAFYVDSTLAEKVSAVGGAGMLRSYDNIAMGSGLSNASTDAFFDSMQLDLTTVPEPATAALVVMIGACLAGARRRS